MQFFGLIILSVALTLTLGVDSAQAQYTDLELGVFPQQNPWQQRLVCGDGEPDPGEECDDGNTISGDGCSATCQLEAIIECLPAPVNSPVNILADGSFENLNAGGEWVELTHSVFGDNLICGDDCFGQPLAAAPDGSIESGNYVLLAGGTFNGPSTGSARHAAVLIPFSAATLEFQWATLASGPDGEPCAGATDGIALSIGGTPVYASTDAGACTNVNPYQRVVIDLATAPGGPYQGQLVDFEFTATATGVPPSQDLTNVFLDDVGIYIPLDADAQPDCEGDGVPDAIDNCLFGANVDQRDSDADGHGNACDGDLNQDCIVNISDLAQFRLRFFSADADADLNGDGIVSIVDLGLLRSLFFTVPGPSPVGALCNP